MFHESVSAAKVWAVWRGWARQSSEKGDPAAPAVPGSNSTRRDGPQDCRDGTREPGHPAFRKPGRFWAGAGTPRRELVGLDAAALALRVGLLAAAIPSITIGVSCKTSGLPGLHRAAQRDRASLGGLGGL